MKEKLLHFVWKLKLFSTVNLTSKSGKKIEIQSVGLANLNAGPDFLNAKIVIDRQLWAGNVEIHINSSDWYVHNHETDESYDSVILHVVWEHDIEVFNKSNQVIPTLELKEFINPNLLINYNELFSLNKKWILCESTIGTVDSFVLNNWFERLYYERLQQKAAQIQQVLNATNNDWEATLFILITRNFGSKVNGDAFFNLANTLNFSIVRKLSNNQKQLEALFIGQAGLLYGNCESNYYKKLKNEYDFLKAKFQLQPISEKQVRFFRLRPNNFPTIRLSQLATLYRKYQNLFSELMAVESVNSFYRFLKVSASPFWNTHYTFEADANKRVKKLSNSFIDLLLINTIIPIKFLYLKSLGKIDLTSLTTIIEHIKPEKNTVISKFSELKIKSENAFKTQALLQLKNEYCNNQQCLQCAIGKELLKST